MNVSSNRLSRVDDTARTSPWRLRALAIAAALVVNVIVLAIARLVNGEFPVADTGNGDQTINFAPVIIVTLLVGAVAAGLLALLERTASRAAAIWTTIALVVFVLSLAGSLGGGVDTSSKLVLTLLHIGAAAPIIPLMRRSATLRG